MVHFFGHLLKLGQCEVFQLRRTVKALYVEWEQMGSGVGLSHVLLKNLKVEHSQVNSLGRQLFT